MLGTHPPFTHTHPLTGGFPTQVLGVGVGAGVGVGVGVGEPPASGWSGGTQPPFTHTHPATGAFPTQPVDVGAGVLLAVIVKLVSDTSKKTLPTAPILIRAVDVGVFGITTSAEPLFAVAPATTVENVVPPSVERLISTCDAFTGDH